MKKTIKDAIEKAIENGFDLGKQLFPYATSWIEITWWDFIRYETSASSKGELCVCSQQPDIPTMCRNYYSIFDLVFGTDFVDRLVGEGEQLICDLSKQRCTVKECSDFIERSFIVKGKIMTTCVHLTKRNIADYHRREMANIKDVQKLKEYIGGLV